MKKKPHVFPESLSTWLIAVMLTVFIALMTGPEARATQSLLDSLNATYPGSSSGANASCASAIYCIS